jgi:ectoine hydroxylase-related dioxygenase (phytanoyl-CoA dioxygenase family)
MTSTLAMPAMNAKITMPRFVLGERFTKEQREYLDTYGFIRFHRFASAQTVGELNREVDALSDRLVREGRRSIHGVPLIMGEGGDGSRFVQRLVFASLFSERLHTFLKDPRYLAILDAAGPGHRIGENERDGLVINTHRNDEGSSYAQLGWHTDSLRDIFYGEKPRRYLNVGFYLTDSSVARGSVRVLPFSHKQGLFRMVTRKLYFADTRPDPSEYALEADAGDLTIHDGRIWHRVARATERGEGSQRRVMYVPLMDGPQKPKNENSPTPLYFRLRTLAKM